MAILRNRSSIAFIVVLLRISFSEASETSSIASYSESKKRRRNALSHRSSMTTSQFPQKRRGRGLRRLPEFVSQSSSGSFTMDSASRRSNGISYESVNTKGPGYLWSDGDVISVGNGMASSSGSTDVEVLSSRYRNDFDDFIILFQRKPITDGDDSGNQFIFSNFGSSSSSKGKSKGASSPSFGSSKSSKKLSKRGTVIFSPTNPPSHISGGFAVSSPPALTLQNVPSENPSMIAARPSGMPSTIPSQPVQASVTSSPTGAVAASAQPSMQPSRAPNAASAEPSAKPSVSSSPTGAVAALAEPSMQPSLAPNALSAEPSAQPSVSNSSSTVAIGVFAQPWTKPSFAPSEEPIESACPQLTSADDYAVYFDDDGGNTPFQETFVVTGDTPPTIEISFPCPFEATTDVGVVALVGDGDDCEVECLYFIPVSNYQDFCNGNQGSSYNFVVPVVQPDSSGLTLYFGYLDEGSALRCQQPLELTTTTVGCLTPSFDDYAPFFDDFENSFTLVVAEYAADFGGVEVFFTCSDEATTNIGALVVDDVSCQVGCVGFALEDVCNEATFGEVFLFIEGDFPDGSVLAVGHVADDFILECEQELGVFF